MEEFEADLEEVVLVPSTGGVFEVDLGEERIYSKKQTGKHVEHDVILRSLRERLRP